MFESRYDLISALHKSVRGSQPGAAMYWLARMLEAGEDPLYVARRYEPLSIIYLTNALVEREDAS